MSGRVSVAAALAVLVCGCTTATGGGAATGGPAAPSPAGPAEAPSAQQSVAPSGQPPRRSPATRQPLVLATPLFRPRVELSLAQARRLLAGRERAVVVAPGAATATDVPPVRSAGAALRAVERGDAALAVLPADALRPTVRVATVAGVDPVRDPQRYPLTVPGPAPARPVTLTVTGDVMLGRDVPDPAAALAPMSGRLRGADLTVGNLESTLSRAGLPQQGGDSFAAPPSVLDPLARAGFDALSLANNHTGDFQQAALTETVRRVRTGGIQPFGAGTDLPSAGRAAVLARNGVRFGFLAFNAIGESPRAAPGQPGVLSVRMPPRTGPLNRADLAHVLRLVRALERRVDVVVVLPHWGTQYTHAAEPVQRTVARRLAAAGADLVVGGHPHWVQGLDLAGDTLVAHSLGNFVFDMDFMTPTQQGVLLETTWWGRRLMSVELVPYRLDRRFAPRSAGAAESQAILDTVRLASFGPFSAGGAS